MQRGNFFSTLTAALMLLAVLFGPFAYAAEEGTEVSAGELSQADAYVMRDDPPEIIPDDIVNFKAKLLEMGFYSLGADEATLRAKELDDLTMAAVKLMCQLNDMTFFPDGVSNEQHWRVMGEYGAPLKTPMDIYDHLTPGAQGVAVTTVQERLTELGYDDPEDPFTEGVYDAALQRAVDAFAAANNLDSGGAISVQLQEQLFGEDAVARAGDASGLMGTFSLFGLHLPYWSLLVLAGLIVVVVAVVIILRKRSSADSGSTQTPEKIQFMVEFEGNTHAYSQDKGKHIRIGRASEDVPLDPTDQAVSRDHGEITLEKGNLVYRDTSRFGTKINGVECHDAQRVLHPGDVLELGKHRITVLFKE